jgi:hypothetical protein
MSVSCPALSQPLASELMVKTTSLYAAAFVYALDPHSLILIDDGNVPFHFCFDKRSLIDLRRYERGESAIEPKMYTHAIGELRDLVRKTREKNKQ